MTSPYTSLPLEGPHNVDVGHALITLVEPHFGHEQAYNRWYEDDHMFSGAFFLPWLFSGRRWVATYDLQQLRYPKEGSVVAQPISKGCYLTMYWITRGRLDQHKEWSYSVYQRLAAEDRLFNHRDHVYTSFQDKVCSIYRDEGVPHDVFTLLDPATGLCLEIVDCISPSARPQLEQWLSEQHIPSRIKSTGAISSVMIFRTRGLDTALNSDVASAVGKATTVANDPCRLTIFWFLTAEPHSVWNDFFQHEPKLIEEGKLGQVSLLAPFIPTKLGTDMYVDKLRKAQ